MSTNITYALAFAIIGMGTRFIVFMLGWDSTVSTQLYFLYLLVAIFLGSREFFNKNPQSTFGQLFKNGAQTGSVFTLLVTIFTFLFYRFIDVTFFDVIINSRLEEAVAAGYSEEEVGKLKENLGFVFSPNTHSLATLIGFMILGFTYSAIVSVILSRVPFFSRQFK